jgi:Lrp/AsnC family transcriptional regulator for asnA, asnC and gidA
MAILWLYSHTALIYIGNLRERGGEPVIPVRYPEYLDPIDISLIRELETDARQPNSHLAAKLGVSRPTIRSRIQKLLDAGVISIACLANPIALGYTTTVILAINTQLDKLEEVTGGLRSCPPVRHAMLCTGRFDIIAAATLRDHHELASFLSYDLRAIPGLARLETMLTLNLVKVSITLLADEGRFAVEHPAADLDTMDLALIRELEADARQTSNHLASKLGTSGATVRRKIQQLLRRGIIRIQAIADPFALGFDGMASIGLKVDPSRVNEAAEAIASYRNVQTVSICTGRYDIVAWAVFSGVSDLQHFITSELGRVAGLRDIETMTNLKLLKFSRRLLTNNE